MKRILNKFRKIDPAWELRERYLFKRGKLSQRELKLIRELKLFKFKYSGDEGVTWRLEFLPPYGTTALDEKFKTVIY
jgi:hypothetical protein